MKRKGKRENEKEMTEGKGKGKRENEKEMTEGKGKRENEKERGKMKRNLKNRRKLVPL